MLFVLPIGLLAGSETADPRSPVWQTALSVLAPASSLLSVTLIVLAWRSAAGTTMESAAVRNRHATRGLRFLLVDLLAPPSGPRQRTRHWVTIAGLSLLVLLLVLVFSYWSGDWTGWSRPRDGLPTRCLCLYTAIALCFALIHDGLRDQSSVRVLRVLPLTVHQVRRRVFRGTVTLQAILIFLLPVLVAAPLDALLLLGAFAAMAAAVAPWVAAVHCGCVTKDIGCFTGFVATLVVVLFVVPLVVGDETYLFGVLGSMLAACVGIPGLIASRALLVVERVTPRSSRLGRE